MEEAEEKSRHSFTDKDHPRSRKNIEDIYYLGPTFAKRICICCEKETEQSFICKKFDRHDLLEYQQEFQIMRDLQNEPRIVNYVAHFVGQTCCYLIMEYCRKGDLHNLMSKRKNFTSNEKEAACIFRQVMEAIDSCHKNSVMHRDIKLGNIFLCSIKPPVVKLGDFGISTRFKKGNQNFIDYRGHRVGTPRYCAPEIVVLSDSITNRPPELEGINGYSEAVDVWSCGVVLYKMLSGEFPFEGGEHKKHSPEFSNTLRQQILFNKPNLSNYTWSRISSSAKDLVAKMLQKNPNQRLTVAQVLDHPWLNGNSEVMQGQGSQTSII